MRPWRSPTKENPYNLSKSKIYFPEKICKIDKSVTRLTKKNKRENITVWNTEWEGQIGYTRNIVIIKGITII